jgi:hypothetical protein
MHYAEIPPPGSAMTEASDDRGSARHLEDVGVENVLASMIEGRKRASIPAPTELDHEFLKAR